MSATGNEFVKLQQFKTAMDSKQPDLTGVVKYDGPTFSTSDYDFISDVVLMDDVALDQIYLQASSSGSSIIIGSETSAEIRVQNDTASHEVSFGATPSSASFSIDYKSVSSITDAIADSPAGSALVTDKAVADYIKSLVATDGEFDSVFGL